MPVAFLESAFPGAVSPAARGLRARAGDNHTLLLPAASDARSMRRQMTRRRVICPAGESRVLILQLRHARPARGVVLEDRLAPGGVRHAYAKTDTHSRAEVVILLDEDHAGDL